MNFWASAEVHLPADAGLEAVRQAVEPYLNASFSDSSLAEVEGKLRYVPIVMPVEMHKKYSERSGFSRKERVYDCAPHLDYEAFVSGTFEEQLHEYLRGISLAAPHLAKLGASKRQIAEFEEILRTAGERILFERPDKTRH